MPHSSDDGRHAAARQREQRLANTTRRAAENTLSTNKNRKKAKEKKKAKSDFCCFFAFVDISSFCFAQVKSLITVASRISEVEPLNDGVPMAGGSPRPEVAPSDNGDPRRVEAKSSGKDKSGGLRGSGKILIVKLLDNTHILYDKAKSANRDAHGNSAKYSKETVSSGDPMTFVVDEGVEKFLTF